MRRIFLAALSLGWATNVCAYFQDGNALIEEMRQFEMAERKDPATRYEMATHFAGFVTGVHDTISLSLCGAENANVRQVTTIAAKYLNEHPADWGKPAYRLVTTALREAFPCPAK